MRFILAEYHVTCEYNMLPILISSLHYPPLGTKKAVYSQVSKSEISYTIMETTASSYKIFILDLSYATWRIIYQLMTMVVIQECFLHIKVFFNKTLQKVWIFLSNFWKNGKFKMLNETFFYSEFCLILFMCALCNIDRILNFWNV